MQNSTTVYVKRNIAPAFGILGATIAMLIVVPLFVSPQSVPGAQLNQEVAKKAMAQPIYQDIARSIELLQSGQTSEAGILLDNKRYEAFIITAGGTGEGIMESDSPTTLLMRLGRTVRDVIPQQVKAGNTEEALTWVARLHTLAEQAANTPEPSVAALQMVYYIKGIAYQSEIAICKETGNTQRIANIQKRKAKMDAFWAKQILPSISEANQRWDRMATEANRIVGSNRDITRNASHTICAEEKTLAESLLHSLTQSMRV
jgi:hypothetical protein